MTTTETAAARILAALQAKRAAEATYEQTIRDEVNADRISVSAVARAIGLRGRATLYSILGRGADGAEPTRPQPVPVVYLRGAGCKEATWERVQRAMWARGWATVNDRTQAWHLARGGVPVVACDFSTDLDRTPGPWYGYDLYVRVARVRARYQETVQEVLVERLLTTADSVRLSRHRPTLEWLATPVQQVVTELDLQPLAVVEASRPTRRVDGGEQLDEQALARMVADAFAPQPSGGQLVHGSAEEH